MTLKEAEKVLSQKPSGLSAESEAKYKKALRRIVIFKTSWYLDEVINPLEKSALKYLLDLGIPREVISVEQIPGSFELPLAVLQSYPFDFAIALGCVVQGDTPHFDYVCTAVTQGLMQVQLSCRAPVGFGVLTVSKLEQAVARKDKGAEAAQAAYLMYLQASKQKENISR